MVGLWRAWQHAILTDVTYTSHVKSMFAKSLLDFIFFLQQQQWQLLRHVNRYRRSELINCIYKHFNTLKKLLYIMLTRSVCLSRRTGKRARTFPGPYLDLHKALKKVPGRPLPFLKICMYAGLYVCRPCVPVFVYVCLSMYVCMHVCVYPRMGEGEGMKIGLERNRKKGGDGGDGVE